MLVDYWHPFNKSFEEFITLGKCISGTLLEVFTNGKRKLFLVGDINTFGSAVEGNYPINKDSIVLRFRYVWGHWEAL